MDSKRAYLESHPWLNFRVDLTRAPWTLWHKLGEAVADCEALTRVPLRPEVAQRLHEIYLAKGAKATTAIEGNTLSEEQVLQLVQRETLDLPPSQQYQEVEVQNVIDAVNDICLGLMNGDRVLNPGVIADYNRRILKGTPVRDEVAPGDIRHHDVAVGSYRAVPWQDAGHLLDRLCEWLDGSGFDPPAPEMKMSFAIIKAVLAHLYFVWVHPFGDGNGRTARLMEFHILIEAGVPFPAAHLLSNYYNQTRSLYYAELERASKTGDPLPFLIYAVTGMEEGLQQQLEAIRNEHWDVAWENFVHSEFHGKHGETAERRKRVVLAVSKAGRPVRRSDIPDLSPRLARMYANKTDKTITRDINALARMELVRRTKEGLVPTRERLLAFSPPADRRDVPIDVQEQLRDV